MPARMMSIIIRGERKYEERAVEVGDGEAREGVGSVCIHFAKSPRVRLQEIGIQKCR